MCSGGITTGWGAMRVSGAQAAAGRVLEGAVYALISALFIYLSADMLWTLASSWGAAIRAAAVLAALAACVCALVRQRALARTGARAFRRDSGFGGACSRGVCLRRADAACE